MSLAHTYGDIERREARNFSFGKAASVVLFLGLALTAAAQNASQHLKLSLISEKQSLQPGSQEWIGLRFQLEPGWHIYWTNPGDSGEPPKVSWQLPTGFQVGALQFPAPRRLEANSLTDYGYESEVLLLARLSAPQKVVSPKADIAADVKWLVCREVCIPGRGQASLSLSWNGTAGEPADAGLLRAAEQRLPQPPPKTWRFSAKEGRGNFVLAVHAGHAIHSADFIPTEPQQIENSPRPIVRPLADGAELTLKKSDQLLRRPGLLRGILIIGGKAFAVNFPLVQTAKPVHDSSSLGTKTAKIEREIKP